MKGTFADLCGMERRRGLILSKFGRDRLTARLDQLLRSEEILKTTGAEVTRYCEEQGSSLAQSTITRILKYKPVDYSSLKGFFLAMKLVLEKADYESAEQESKDHDWGKIDPYISGIFRTLVERKTSEFVGRQYIFDAIDDFFTANPCGYISIKAKPGVGKSAILAEYVKRTGCIAHFNSRPDGITRTEQFLESICVQLIERYGVNNNLPLPPGATEDGRFLNHLLEQAAQRAPESPVFIAIDALDEVNLASQSSGANVLYLPQYLPANVYVLLTQRSDVPLPFHVFVPHKIIDLMGSEYTAESSQDIELYIRAQSERTSIQHWLHLQALDKEDFVTQLRLKSELNFMYLFYVLGDIEQGRYQDLSIQHLPSGLENYYETHWQLMGMTAQPLPRSKIRIVYVLATIEQAVSIDHISRISGDDVLTVQEVLTHDFRQFLLTQNIEDELCYSVYHLSFSDFLYRKDIVQAAGVMLEEIMLQITNSLWEGVYGDEQL
ncbi:ATP-binding protein [Nodosilinea sp. LEGE 06152]|nr:ATP-binding protein [Nodosilinea sp. LEGE 06152]